MNYNENNKNRNLIDIYKYIFDITYFNIEFNWYDLERTIDEVMDILTNSNNNEKIEYNVLLNYVMEEIAHFVPKGELSPAEFKRKRIVVKYNKLKEIYDKIKIPIPNEEQVIINNTKEYFKSKEFIKLSTLGEYISKKPIDLKYYETFDDFLSDIKEFLTRKNNPKYKIRQLYLICKKMLDDIPKIISDNCIDKTDFEQLVTISKLITNHLETTEDQVINTGGIAEINYQKERIIKLNRINTYSPEPHISK